MQKKPPTLGQIIIAIGFALSCFGLLLFLWLAFGGPVPLASEGYRVTVPFQEATQLAVESDVRISGVPVGKVKAPPSRSTPSSRRSPRTRARLCDRRRSSARPTSS